MGIPYFEVEVMDEEVQIGKDDLDAARELIDQKNRMSGLVEEFPTKFWDVFDTNYGEEGSNQEEDLIAFTASVGAVYADEGEYFGTLESNVEETFAAANTPSSMSFDPSVFDSAYDALEEGFYTISDRNDYFTIF